MNGHRGIRWSGLLAALFRLLGPVIRTVTAELRDELFEALSRLYQKAVETENPYDDFLLDLLFDMLGFNKPE